MIKLERITLGDLGDLNAGKVLTAIGNTVIRDSRADGSLIIETPNEVKRIEQTDFPGHRFAFRQEFLPFVDKVLKNNGWYLAEAGYIPHKKGFFQPQPNILEGKLYTE